MSKIIEKFGLDKFTGKKGRMKTETLSVMFIDIVSYTKTTAALSRDSFNKLHDVFDDISIPTVEEFHGTIVKKIGDAFLFTFKSATDAVLCGMELQRRFIEYNHKNNLPRPLQIRVAIHSGEVMLRKNDIYGDAVNTAARIESVTKANHVVFSESVFAAMNKNEIPFIHVGLKRLKGLKYPIRLFKVRTREDEIRRESKIRKKKSRKLIGRIKRFMAMGIILLVAYFILRYLSLFF